MNASYDEYKMAIVSEEFGLCATAGCYCEQHLPFASIARVSSNHLGVSHSS